MDAAGRHFAEGLRLMAEARLMRHLLALLASAGDWLVRMGRAEEAAVPLALVHDHPASDHEARARARNLLAAVAAALPSATYDAAAARGRQGDPVDLAVRLAHLLDAPPASDLTRAEREDASASPSNRKAASAITGSAALPHELTPREAEVLRLLAEGMTDHEIGARLSISRNTVASHTRAIYGKLGVTTRAAAARLAVHHGLA
jgi:DNA-binding NarL/FixJ family response regulator